MPAVDHLASSSSWTAASLSLEWFTLDYLFMVAVSVCVINVISRLNYSAFGGIFRVWFNSTINVYTEGWRPSIFGLEITIRCGADKLFCMNMLQCGTDVQNSWAIRQCWATTKHTEWNYRPYHSVAEHIIRNSCDVCVMLCSAMQYDDDESLHKALTVGVLRAAIANFI